MDEAITTVLYTTGPPPAPGELDAADPPASVALATLAGPPPQPRDDDEPAADGGVRGEDGGRVGPPGD